MVFGRMPSIGRLGRALLAAVVAVTVCASSGMHMHGPMVYTTNARAVPSASPGPGHHLPPRVAPVAALRHGRLCLACIIASVRAAMPAHAILTMVAAWLPMASAGQGILRPLWAPVRSPSRGPPLCPDAVV